MIHDEIVTYEVAKLAKEKGFDWDCPTFYNPEGELKYGWAYDSMNSGLDMRDMLCHNSKLPLGFGAECAAPTQSLLQRWLREEKKIEVYVRNFEKTTNFPHHYWNFITDGNGKTLKVGNKMFDTYELALEDALKYALENLV